MDETLDQAMRFMRLCWIIGQTDDDKEEPSFCERREAEYKGK